MSITSIAISSGQIKSWKRLASNSSIHKMSIDDRKLVLPEVKDVSQPINSIIYANAIRRKDQQRPSFHSAFSRTHKAKNPITTLQTPKPYHGEADSKDQITNSDKNLQQKIKDLQDQMYFIKKEHTIMLDSLHNEIELLKVKNKELQFQMVMNNFDPSLDLETKISPNYVDDHSTPITATEKDSIALEIELETHIQRLESDLYDAKSRNLQLSDLLEQERRKLQKYELLGHLKEDVNGKNDISIITMESSTIQKPFNGSTSSFAESPTSINLPMSHLKPIITNCVKIDKTLTSNAQAQLPDESRNDVCNENGVNVGSEDDEISLPDTPVSSISTPTPPAEYVEKLQEAEVMIVKLRKENRHQRKELIDIKTSIDRTTSLKFRGCNHPNLKVSHNLRLNPSQNGNKYFAYNRENVRLKSRHFMNQSMVTLNHLYHPQQNTDAVTKHFSPTQSPTKTSSGPKSYISRHISRKNYTEEGTKTFPRSESLDTFPPLPKQFVKHERTRSPLHSELPPVSGGSGSETTRHHSPSKPVLFNLVTLKSKKLLRETLAPAKCSQPGKCPKSIREPSILKNRNLASTRNSTLQDRTSVQLDAFGDNLS